MTERVSKLPEEGKREGARETTDKIVQLDSGNATIDAGDDLLRDGDGVDMVHVETIAKPRHPGRDLVELDTFLAAIWRERLSVGLEVLVEELEAYQGLRRWLRTALSYKHLDVVDEEGWWTAGRQWDPGKTRISTGRRSREDVLNWPRG